MPKLKTERMLPLNQNYGCVWLKKFTTLKLDHQKLWPHGFLVILLLRELQAVV